MSYNEKEIHEFLDFLVQKIKAQSEDIDRRITQFHDQRCDTPTEECRKVTTRAMKEAVLDAVLQDQIEEQRKKGNLTVVNLDKFRKMKEGKYEGGLGFYL